MKTNIALVMLLQFVEGFVRPPLELLHPVKASDSDETEDSDQNSSKNALHKPLADKLRFGWKKAFFIDKTDFVFNFMTDPNAHILIARPPRFGKSIALDMTSHFLNIRENSSIFQNTKVAKRSEFCRKHQNKYPIIKLDFRFAGFAKTWDAAKKELKTTINSMVRGHNYLITEDPKTNSSYEDRKKWYDDVMSAKSLEKLPDPSKIMKKLTEYVSNHFNKSVIVLVNNYDTPIHAAYINGYYDEMVSFLNGLLRWGLQDNPYVTKSLTVGVTRIALTGLTELDHIKDYTVTDERYSDDLGFNEDEIKLLIHEYEYPPNLIDDIKENYGGLAAPGALTGAFHS